MHRRRKGTSYIPFLLNLETRLDVILVRIHFCESLPQARLLISHRKVCVNQVIVCISHLKVSHGDIISFQENEVRTRGEEIRRSFYIEISVEKRIGKFLNSPVRMWRRSKREWFRLLKTKRGWRQLLKSDFLQELRSSMQKEDNEKMKKLLGSKKVCLGSYLAEHKRMKRNFYDFKFLPRRMKEKKRDLPPLTRSTRVYNSSLLDRNSTYCSASAHQFTRKIKRKIKRKRIELPTHYSEVNHRTPKAVVSYGPNIGHIPHEIRLKDPNLLLQSGCSPWPKHITIGLVAHRDISSQIVQV
uniref:Ribosomal protein S4 n=1 Tax=Platycodon grandiflorus TaxID=94286 RepID=A0A288W742_PLAGD|nr:ribosomal protein S4 [Platycodon grandiflorus]ARR27548.1 ribosomal protein S4 [Platycodon grandiflorus]